MEQLTYIVSMETSYDQNRKNNVILGSYDTLETAKSSIDSNSRLLMGEGDVHLSIYEVPLDKFLVFRFDRDSQSMKKAFEKVKQQEQRAEMMIYAEQEHLNKHTKSLQDIIEDEVKNAMDTVPSVHSFQTQADESAEIKDRSDETPERNDTNVLQENEETIDHNGPKTNTVVGNEVVTIEPQRWHFRGIRV